jgi:alpha-amylase/alpha-mannosidase (GH57 family)
MHQPYYKNLLTQETDAPWVRLHGVKDYADMVKILAKYPLVHQTFNLVPSLIEQIDDYINDNIKDKFFELSLKLPDTLTVDEKRFISNNFFKINPDTVIAMHPRYYELYFKKERREEFTAQDILDLQVWFNLAWIDPIFRKEIAQLKKIEEKGRFFTQEEKLTVLNKQKEILKNIIPIYKEFIQKGQIETTISPFYHPILPLLYNTNIAKEANKRITLPKENFSHPQDISAQLLSAVNIFTEKFGFRPNGMWPSEEAVSNHIVPSLIASGIKWIVADEAILFKSLKKKARDTKILYQPHFIKTKEGKLVIVFRDRNLSDLIGFLYHKYRAEDAVADLMKHLKNIALAFKDQDILVTIALDGENAWEYYANDGHDFLELLYKNLSQADFLKCVTVNEYLTQANVSCEIKKLAAGSWIYGEFSKWMGNASKNRAWDALAKARKLLINSQLPTESETPADPIRRGAISQISTSQLKLAWKQMYILEGSDWFWWYGEDPEGDFDRLFRMHLANFYKILDQAPPEYLKNSL